MIKKRESKSSRGQDIQDKKEEKMSRLKQAMKRH